MPPSPSWHCLINQPITQGCPQGPCHLENKSELWVRCGGSSCSASTWEAGTRDCQKEGQPGLPNKGCHITKQMKEKGVGEGGEGREIPEARFS